MEPQRFDQLATMVGRGSRRRVLGGLLSGALVAGTLVRWTPCEEAAAKDGASGGLLGGRHGQNQRGQDPHRSHGDKKSQKKQPRNQHQGGFGSGTGLRDCSQVSKVPGADLSLCDLRGADLRFVKLSDANLTGANLQGANLQAADLRFATLTGATLTGANLPVADLLQANLSGAELREAFLGTTNLLGANLNDADLRGANLSGANLFEAVLTASNLTDVIFCHTLMPDGHERNDNC
jgi:hypothetical protein